MYKLVKIINIVDRRTNHDFVGDMDPTLSVQLKKVTWNVSLFLSEPEDLDYKLINLSVAE